MKTLEENEIFKRLSLRRDVISLIFDLRSIRALAHFDNPQEEIRIEEILKHLDKTIHLKERLDSIYEGASKGLVNLEAVDTSDDDLYEQLKNLEKEFPNESPLIRSIDKEIILKKYCCPDIKPLVIELCEFLRTVHTYSNDKDDLKKYISAFLSITTYKRESVIAKYLRTTSPCNANYLAYFYNDSVPMSEHDYLLDELLKTFIDATQENAYAADLVNFYMKFDGYSISSSTYSQLLDNPNNNRQVIEALRNITLKDEFDFEEYIQKRIQEIKDIFELYNLISSLMAAANINTWAPFLADSLLKTPNRDTLLYHTEVYISHLKGPLEAQTWNQILDRARRTEKDEVGSARQNFVMTMKKIKQIQEQK